MFDVNSDLNRSCFDRSRPRRASQQVQESSMTQYRSTLSCSLIKKKERKWKKGKGSTRLHLSTLCWRKFGLAVNKFSNSPTISCIPWISASHVPSKSEETICGCLLSLQVTRRCSVSRERTRLLKSARTFIYDSAMRHFADIARWNERYSFRPAISRVSLESNVAGFRSPFTEIGRRYACASAL